VPIYEYRCDHCGHEFSRQQRFDEEPVATCPNCGKPPRKLLSRPAIVFKGSGWHVTDYRKSSDGAKSDTTGSTDASDKTKKDAPKAPEKKDATNKKEGPPAKSDSADSAAS
jgi:putative FmdB family regulatory protein